jgi:hypothetical protein
MGKNLGHANELSGDSRILRAPGEAAASHPSVREHYAAEAERYRKLAQIQEAVEGADQGQPVTRRTGEDPAEGQQGSGWLSVEMPLP